jgi:hypothetical protein
MKRVFVLVATAAVIAGLAFLPSGAGAGGGANVTVLHGIGPAPSTVDIYLGATDATEWDLLLEAVDYGQSADLGVVPAGGYNVLICAAVTDPAATVSSCPEGAVNGNSGTNAEVPASGDVTLVAAYAGPDEPAAGRPTVVAFVNDVDCYEAGDGRLGARHAATAPAVNILVGGDPVLEDVVFGQGADLTVPAGDYEVEIQLASDDSTVLGPTTVTVNEGELLVLYAVGNPQQDANFDVLTTTHQLEPCPVETTTTTAPEETTTTSTTAPPVAPPPAQPQAQPATFTG